MLRKSVLCPAAAANRVFKCLKWPMDLHLFAFSDRTSLTYGMFQERLCRVLAEMGHESPGLFLSHSYRRGRTMFLFLRGVPVELIKVLENWKFNAFLKYLEFRLETRLVASELVKVKLLYKNYHY